MNIRRFYEFRKIVYDRKNIIWLAQSSWSIINFDQSEPNIIWEYLNKGTDFLNQKIARHISINGFTVKFAGVFIHQKPRVMRVDNNCNNQKIRCELGDLLTVFLLVDKNKNLLFQTAFISQAKKENKVNNECQICLYEFDEEFEFPRNICGNSWNTNLRKKLPKFWRRHKGLNYLILDNSLPYIKYIPFNAEIKIPWGFSIFQMLLGMGGLYFSKSFPKKNPSSWSSIIWDLITCTGQTYFKGQTRENAIRNFLDEFNNFNNYDKNFIESEKEGEGGIPILFIIVQDKESFNKE